MMRRPRVIHKSTHDYDYKIISIDI
jgi:hypothetical protein